MTNILKMTFRRRSLHRIGAATAMALLWLCASVPARADADDDRHDTNHPVVVKDMGIFYVGGERVDSPNSGCFFAFCDLPNNTGVTVQSSEAFFAFVEYFIPLEGHKAPIVLIPGRNIMGNTFQMKPPGGESWTNFFLRHGHPVYLFTQPGRGPAMSYTDQVNNEIQGISPPNTTGKIEHFTDRALGGFGVGPSFGKFYPGVQFPQDVAFYEQAMANWGTAMGPAGPVGDPRTANATINALIKLLERVGPAIVMGHSSGGLEMWTAATQRPDLFKKLVGVEAIGCDPVFAHQLAHIPILNLWGTYAAQRQADFPALAVSFGNPNGALVARCTEMGKAVRSLGGRAGMLYLQDVGLVGTTHLLMYDRVNIDIARLILGWIDGQGDAGLPLH